MWATHSKTQRASTPSNCFRPPATKQTRSACTTIKSKSEAREVQTAKVNVTTVNEKKSDRDFRFFAYDCSWGSQRQERRRRRRRLYHQFLPGFGSASTLALNTRMAPSEYEGTDSCPPVDVDVDTTTCMAKATNNSNASVFIMLNTLVTCLIEENQRERSFVFERTLLRLL